MPAESQSYGEVVKWEPEVPHFRPLQLLISWLIAGVAVFVAAAIVPDVSVGHFADALRTAVLIAVLNAVLPPIVAAIRLPFTLALGFVRSWCSTPDPAARVAHHTRTIRVESFGWALLASVVIAATMVVLEVILDANDDDAYSLRVIRRIARRQAERPSTPTRPESCSSRSTAWRDPCSRARCAMATRPTWRAGSRRAATELDPVGTGPQLADGR